MYTHPFPLNNQTGNRIRKFILRVTTVLTASALIVVSSAVLTPQTASAWTTSIEACEQTPALDFKWKEAILNTPTGKQYIHDYDTWIDAVVLFQVTGSNTYTVAFGGMNSMEFRQSPEGVKTLQMDSVYQYQIVGDEAHANYQKSVSGGNINTATLTNVGCMSGTGINYALGWTGEKISTAKLTEKTSCNSTDIACHIRNTVGRFSDTMLGMAEAILNGFSDFFIPDEADMKAINDDLNTFFDTKLGMLKYPFEFMGAMFDAFNNPTGNCTETTCNKSFGTWYGSELSIDFMAVRTVSPNWWNAMTTITRGLLVVMLVFMLRKKYIEVVTK